MDTSAPIATNTPAPDALPQDVAACHAMILELIESLKKAGRANEQLQARIQQLLQRLFGPRAEKIDPSQLVLFGQEIAQAAQPQTPPDEPEAPAAPKKKGHGRKRIPKEIPRIRIEHTVPPEQCVCEECGRQKDKIGEEVTEQLDYTPASFTVYEHVQPILACRCCQEHVVTAPKPPQPIEKGLPGPGLMAQIITAKYCDHIPLYRQESIYARHGVELARTTMCGWVMSGAELVVPVVDAMIARVVQSKVIHTDDTPVRVQGDEAGAYTGRFWVYIGDGNNPFTVYDYTPSRKRDGPMAFLKDFGKDPAVPSFLQADAFGGYDGIYAASSILEVACMAHGRRKFYDARGTDPIRAHQVLGWIRQLYAIETQAKDLDAAERAAMRQEQAGPILDIWYKWMVDQLPLVLPKSPIGQAIQYALNQWTALNRYLQDGDLDIDNNPAERALRGIAIGRKNWLFLGNDRGGHAAARFYSLIMSAKQNGLEPFAYLRDLFLRIPGHPNKQLADLLPDRWKPNA